MTNEEVLALVSAAAPAHIDRFRWTFAKGESDSVPVAHFDLACAGCGHDRFSAFETVGQFKSERQVTGVALTCGACGARVVVFDGALNGYDGENGHYDFLKISTRDEAMLDLDERPVVNARIRAGFVYNGPWSELEENAEKLGIQPNALYDWFHLQAETKGQWDWVWERECA